MNLTFLHAVPKPAAVVHGSQMEGLFVINTAQQTCTFGYREVVADPNDPTRQTPQPADVVRSMTVPLTMSDLAAIAGIVLQRAAALGQVSGMAPVFAEGLPTQPPLPVSVFASGQTVAPGESVQLTAQVVGCEDQTVVWHLLDGEGTLTPEGLFTAGASEGTARVVAVPVADPLKNAVASVFVVVPTPDPVVP